MNKIIKTIKYWLFIKRIFYRYFFFKRKQIRIPKDYSNLQNAIDFGEGNVIIISNDDKDFRKTK